MASVSVEELKDALKDTLDKSGALRQLKAKLRADIFGLLGADEVLSKPELSNDNLIINELIREYLIFNGYRETLSVMLQETGQPLTRPFDRSFLAQHLGVVDSGNSKQLPLLYRLAAQSQGANQQGKAPAGTGGSS